MELIVQSPAIREWLDDTDPFGQLSALKGRVVRDKEGRTTQRVEINGRGYYLKYHRGIGWKEILKNLAQLRLPVTSARNEWQAIKRLTELGVDTMTIAAYGWKGLNPASRHSFILTEEITDTRNLKVLGKFWCKHPAPAGTRRVLVKRVAQITRTLHHNGINHRDLYVCHFLLDLSSATATTLDPWSPLYLIDLHRTQIRKNIPERWLVKDLGSLYFSILKYNMGQREILLFLTVYFEQPLKTILQDYQPLLKQIELRALKLFQRDFGSMPYQLPVKSLVL